MDGVSKELLIGLSGLLVGALINGLGFLYRTHLDSKKSARRVLYLLLEIRCALHLSMIDTVWLAEQYHQRCVDLLTAKGLPIRPDELAVMMDELIKPHCEETLQVVRTDVEARLLQPFEQALAELSTVDPVLAYRLRGKEKLELVVAGIQNYSARAKAGLSGHSLSAEIAKVDAWARQSAFEALGKALDADIRQLAKACGWRDFFRCRTVLKKSIGTPEALDSSVINARLDRVLELLAEPPVEPRV